MLPMLPIGIITLLALVGITATSAPIAALATALSPVAQPLLLVSIAMLIAGHLRCGWPPVLLAVAGGLLIYSAMYLFTSSPSTLNHAQMQVMSGMPSPTLAPNPDDGMARMTDTAPDGVPMEPMPGIAGATNETLFYVGLALLLTSFGLGWWRRRTNACRPLYPLKALRAAITRRV